MELLQGKTFVVMGVANQSIAWGIARSLHNAGAKLIFTYAGERLERNVRELADTLEGQESLVLPCDVTNDEELTACFETIKQEVGTIHGVAHCIAFANRDDLKGEFVDTSRDGFYLHKILAHSL